MIGVTAIRCWLSSHDPTDLWQGVNLGGYPIIVSVRCARCGRVFTTAAQNRIKHGMTLTIVKEAE